MMRKGWYCPMRMNPVYKREVMVSARSFRLGTLKIQGKAVCDGWS